jgi:hypothetical protein
MRRRVRRSARGRIARGRVGGGSDIVSVGIRGYACSAGDSRLRMGSLGMRDETKWGRDGRKGAGRVFRKRDQDWEGDSLGFRRDDDGDKDKGRRVQGRRAGRVLIQEYSTRVDEG